MIKHFVTFLSPGTIVAEHTTKPIKSWHVVSAKRMAKRIKERHAATPYGFYFTTRDRGENDFDSKETDRSPMYYLGGEVLTLEEVKAKKDPKLSTLIRNMEGNGWERVITNNNSWQWTQPLRKEDIVLDYE